MTRALSLLLLPGVLCLMSACGGESAPSGPSPSSPNVVSPTPAPTPTPSPPPPPAGPPAVTGIFASPSDVGIVSVTEYTYQGIGVQGSSLTYSWNFGDGAVATGQTAVHKYDLPNTYTVRLTVSNSAGSPNATTTTTVKTLTGRWRVYPEGGLGDRANLTLVQTGDRLTGRYVDDDPLGYTDARVEASDIVGKQVRFRVFQDFGNRSGSKEFSMTLNSTADRMCGTGKIMTREGSPDAGDFSFVLCSR